MRINKRYISQADHSLPIQFIQVCKFEVVFLEVVHDGVEGRRGHRNEYKLMNM